MDCSTSRESEPAARLSSAAVRRRFQEIVEEYGPALRRLAAGYEHDPDNRRDLVQEILLAIWRSLPSFEGRSSLRTWIYRVAHNTAVSHIGRACRLRSEPKAATPSALQGEDAAAERDDLRYLQQLIRRLPPLDRQLILLSLEDLPQAEIASITGLSTENVATRICRTRSRLAALLREGN